MTRFKQRIKYYISGLLLGFVFVYFAFGNRACAWLPGNRVKNMIAEKDILAGDSIQFILDCKKIDQDDIYTLLNDNGNVDFSKSKTKEYPKIYWFDGYKENKELAIEFALYDSIAEVVAIHFEGENCQTTLKNKNKSVIPLPNDEVIQIIDSKEFRIKPKAKCQLECLDIPENKIFEFHRTAQYVPELSEPRILPDPYYAMKGNVDGKEITVIYVSGDSRTRVSEIISTSDCNCPN